jgi:D-aminopeptidase
VNGGRPRARDLGLRIGALSPGPLDAITDVPGVRVGSVTLVSGEGPLRRGEGPVRTGVTVVLPHDGRIFDEPVFAGCHRLNGNGELTGLEWIRESGRLTTPIGLTNTHSVGVVRDALVAAGAAQRAERDLFWSLPVVGETWDGLLNDINGFHVRSDHVQEALRRAADGPVEEGAVGSGTGMICHGFKGGLGTASRVVAEASGGWTVGVLVQANHGRRERLRVGGVAVGEAIGPDVVPLPEGAPGGAGSIIVVCATDAPLLPHQCTRLAQRCALGVARTGGSGEHWSGDLMLAFSTARQGIPASEVSVTGERVTVEVTMLVDSHIDALFDAAIEATEAAIVSALLAAETMTGRDGITAHALEAPLLMDALRRASNGPGSRI